MHKYLLLLGAALTGCSTETNNYNDADTGAEEVAYTVPLTTTGTDDTSDTGTDDTDSGTTTTVYYYADGDGDGFGLDASKSTDKLTGYVAVGGDCDDDVATTFPGAAQAESATACMADADLDGWGSSALATSIISGTDCNDANDDINPGVTEVVGNGNDDDCNSNTSDSGLNTYYRDGDGDGYGLLGTTTTGYTAPSGYVTNSTDCLDTDAKTFPGAAELNSTTACETDLDGDGYGSSAIVTNITSGTDCIDSDAAVHPGATEVTGNGKDDDCSTTTSDTATTSASLIREVCVTTATSAWQLAFMDTGESTHTNWVTEVSSTATVVSPLISGASGSATTCASVTLTGAGTTLKFNGYGSDSELWGHYLVGSTGSGTYAQTSGTKSAEIIVKVDSVVNGTADSSAETATISGDDLVWAD